jgi:peptidoglycan/xylan/chitin deacetylase (PgdA/CDA1 family)
MVPHGIMFHHFHGGSAPRVQGSISAHQLTRIIESLGRQRILSAEEWMRRAATGTLRGQDLCLTFDDNLRCQYDVAYPVLREYGIKAFWFVYTSVLQGGINRLEIYRRFRTTKFGSVEEFYEAFFEAAERSSCARSIEEALRGYDASDRRARYPFYSDADLRFRYIRDRVIGPDRYDEIMEDLIASTGSSLAELSHGLWMDDGCLRTLHEDGHIIGLHSHTHPTRMQDLTPAIQEREYRTNYEYLHQLLGVAPVSLSHPSNSYDSVTLEILRRLGISLGFCDNMQGGIRSALEYPRQDHANIIGTTE